MWVGLSEILFCIAWYMCMRMVEMSFIEVSAECHFPIQNLPYGIFSTASNVRGRVRVSKDFVRSACRCSLATHCTSLLSRGTVLH